MGLAWSEFIHWNVQLGCQAVRLSVADENGQEFFTIAPRPRTGWSAERARLVALIGEAIEEGAQPGEVVLDA